MIYLSHFKNWTIINHGNSQQKIKIFMHKRLRVEIIYQWYKLDTIIYDKETGASYSIQ